MIDLPPDIAKAFVRDMRANFAEKNAIKRDEIAARQPPGNRTSFELAETRMLRFDGLCGSSGWHLVA
jgi:hypothetical protein